ncbi:MAG: glycosyltransferase [Lachnospiraceae bacterium]|nr:glycosyltransferase [Lachnospiraceae bacterium]
MPYPISVCMIAKNEEKYIEKCLSAIRSHTKETAEVEIILADTGSTDRTKEIAAKYADKVLDFAWVNDFSAARNYSIAQASNDYILSLDCDEIITQLDCEQLFTLIRQHPGAVGRIAIDNHYYSNQTDTVYTDRLGRFFSRKYFRFEAPIHEQVVHKQNGACYQSYDAPITVDHVGYLGSIEALRPKVERNNTLLFQELEKDRENPYLYFQIGQSYNMIYDYENSYQYYKEALNYDIDPEEEWVQMMIIAYANALLHTGRETDALQLEAIYDAFAGTADFLCMMGRIYLANRQYVKAMMEFVKAIHCPVARENGTNSFLPTYNIGLINEMMGDIPTALMHYRNCGEFPLALQKILELEGSNAAEASHLPR